MAKSCKVSDLCRDIDDLSLTKRPRTLPSRPAHLVSQKSHHMIHHQYPEALDCIIRMTQLGLRSSPEAWLLPGDPQWQCDIAIIGSQLPSLPLSRHKLKPLDLIMLTIGNSPDTCLPKLMPLLKIYFKALDSQFSGHIFPHYRHFSDLPWDERVAIDQLDRYLSQLPPSQLETYIRPELYMLKFMALVNMKLGAGLVRSRRACPDLRLSIQNSHIPSYMARFNAWVGRMAGLSAEARQEESTVILDALLSKIMSDYPNFTSPYGANLRMWSELHSYLRQLPDYEYYKHICVSCININNKFESEAQDLLAILGLAV